MKEAERVRKADDLGFRDMVIHARKVKGLSQKTLGERSGVGRNVINNIERGLTVPSDDLKFRISEELNIEPIQEADSLVWGASTNTNKEIPGKEHECDIENLVVWFSLFARRNPRQAERLRALAARMAEARQVGDSLLVEVADQSLEQTIALYGGCALGSLTMVNTSEIEFWRHLLESAKKSIKATSCLHPNAWWNTPDGIFYHKANIQKMKEGDGKVTIERIFVFRDKSEANDVANLIREQIDCGMNIWVGFSGEVSHGGKFPAEKALDFYIIDDKYVGTLQLQNRNAIQASLFSVSNYQVSRYRILFEDMKNFSTPITSQRVLDGLLKNQVSGKS